MAALRGVLGAALAGLTLTACAAEVSVHGHMPEVEDIAEIQPGVDTRQDVITRLGTPSALSTFEDHKWYYIGQTVEQFAFLKPDVLDRSVLVIAFNDRGLVQDTHLYTLNDGRKIKPVSRITPTAGTELTFLQQLFGNLGKLPTGLEQGGAEPATRPPL